MLKDRKKVPQHEQQFFSLRDLYQMENEELEKLIFSKNEEAKD
jgi:hypothetical protein